MGGSGTVVIGIGNEHRSDDRCGLDVVRSLRRRVEAGARFHELGDDAIELLDIWSGATRAYVVDAVRTGAPPGTVQRWEVDDERTLEDLTPSSTHALSLRDAVGLGRSLGRMPSRLIVFGIEAAEFTPGTGLTPAVRGGVEETVRRLLGELSDAGGPIDA